MRENEGYRETLVLLRERFGGKDNITGRELAEYVGMDYQTALSYVRSGKLPGKLVGRRYIITIAQLARWETSR